MLIKKNLDKRTQIEIEGSPSEIFQAIAISQELFQEECCGICQSPSIFRVRNVENSKQKKSGVFTYYEKVCSNLACRAKLQFGVSADASGGLFPKRKLEDGSFDRESRGWSRYVPENSR